VDKVSQSRLAAVKRRRKEKRKMREEGRGEKKKRVSVTFGVYTPLYITPTSRNRVEGKKKKKKDYGGGGGRGKEDRNDYDDYLWSLRAEKEKPLRKGKRKNIARPCPGAEIANTRKKKKGGKKSVEKKGGKKASFGVGFQSSGKAPEKKKKKGEEGEREGCRTE